MEKAKKAFQNQAGLVKITKKKTIKCSVGQIIDKETLVSNFKNLRYIVFFIISTLLNSCSELIETRK